MRKANKHIYKSVVDTSLLNQTRQSKTQEFFKPMIAASLAFSLSTMSVAQGADPSPADPNTPTITLKIGNGSVSEDKSKEFQIQWNKQQSQTNVFVPSSSSTTLENLSFSFSGNSSSTAVAGSTVIATVPSNQSTIVTMNGNNNGIQMDKEH